MPLLWKQIFIPPGAILLGFILIFLAKPFLSPALPLESTKIPLRGLAEGEESGVVDQICPASAVLHFVGIWRIFIIMTPKTCPFGVIISCYRRAKHVK